MSLPHALLGILKYKPMTGYELKKFFDDSVNFFWSAQMSQIYRELKKLEQKGWINSAEEASTKGPNKIVYSLTSEGLSSLKKWLSFQPDHIDEDNRNAFLLRMMLMSNLGAGEMQLQIQKRLEKYRSDLEALQDVENKLEFYLEQTGKKDELPYWQITLNRGFHDVKSHIKWAEESLELLKNKILQTETLGTPGTAVKKNPIQNRKHDIGD